ncbi:hypothetical protein DPMN_104451 [Dreissena polymorpha]|uniref:Uncharacterized protein n=1 Tax=Dreissena polymorpha TaxID=45954 RepID=A0A9D4H7S7_DREPO|nr:hypothetical protein DPMN_104451 [Dreissena polymorpha]
MRRARDSVSSGGERININVRNIYGPGFGCWFLQSARPKRHLRDGAAPRASCFSILDGDGGNVTVSMTGYRLFPDRMCYPAICVDLVIAL